MKADRESALFSPDAAMLESGLVEESRMIASGICHGDRRASHPHSQAREHVLEVALCEDVKTNSNNFWKQKTEILKIMA